MHGLLSRVSVCTRGGSREMAFPGCSLSPAGAAWSSSRSHPPEVKTSAPVDKGKHEGNDFLQLEYIKLYFFSSCSLLFKKDRIMLPLTDLMSILWPEETSALHGSLNCPSQFPLRVPFSSTDSSCLQLPSFLPTSNPKARSPS